MGAAGLRIDRVEQVIADEVALDQVAHVGRVGHRDADAEPIDDEPAQDAVRGIEDEAGSLSGLAAVDDDADLGIITVSGRGGVGDRSDHDRVARRHASLNLRSDQDSRGRTRHTAGVADQVGNGHAGVGALKCDRVKPGRAGDRDIPGQAAGQVVDRRKGSLDLGGRGVEGDGSGCSDRQRGESAQGKRPASDHTSDRDRLDGRADLGRIAERDARFALRVAVDRDGLGDRGQGREQLNGPGLGGGIEAGHGVGQSGSVAAGMSKRIVLGNEAASAFRMAWRSEPGPESLVLVTTNWPVEPDALSMIRRVAVG